MSEPSSPQIYLITPPGPELGSFLPRLARLLDEVPVGCLRLSTAGMAEDAVRRAADSIRDAAHARDVAVVIETHLMLVEPHGLDGVHLMDATRSVRTARKALGPDRIVGAWCGASRHAGMNAAEIGVDYVALGPFGQDGALGRGDRADPDLVRWWGEMIETPVVAEGALTPEAVAAMGGGADFLGLGREIWDHPDGEVAALRGFLTLT